MRNWLVALGVLLAVPALGAVAVQQSVESLARGSDAVVRGTVTKRSAHWEGGRIFTDVEVQVAEVWRGRTPAKVTVSVPGGEVGKLGQWVPGAPSFADAEDVALFLTRGAGAGRYGVTGLALGKFSLAGQTAKPNLAGMETLAQPLAAGERGAEPMPLAELRRRVKEAR
ncbi:hypothetical protein [Anaeromyxobacter paludicola]|uniref:CHRD domain-containing protein n=1 Tax=Anaeromyxobacter paludicola TaxID=2918171 RepID=A0ABM7X5D1_9BACT|nr:hypothetical protein [Anaeromyxobacter paludicola]BDG07000.1 hypothetical protein AMPC_01130 [Anaeromyxobacter paludicola]